MIKSFEITAEDYTQFSKFAFNRLQGTKSPKKWTFIKNFFSWLLIGIILVTIFEKYPIISLDFHLKTFLISSVVYLTIILSFIYNSINLQRLATPNPDGLMLGSREIEFNEN